MTIEYVYIRIHSLLHNSNFPTLIHRLI